MATVEYNNGSASFRVAKWEVYPGACEIARDKTVVKLEPKVMDLLQLLASRPGEVFTRIQLEDLVWPNMVVGYDALTKSIGKLREALGDTSKPPTYIQTIPKKGYRLIASVTAGSNISDEAHTESAVKIPSFKTSNRVIAISLLTLTALFGFALFTTLQPELNTSGQPDTLETISKSPRVVVLPFKNLNADPQQDYFSQGITDDLITDLSGYSGMEIISSRISSQYRSRNVDINTLTNELDVRYVIEGSIRRSAEQVRINVQVVDAKHGTNLWAEQYNQPVTGLFDIQDEVRSKIISALSLKLSEAERKRKQKRYTNNYRAYDTFLRGQNSLIKRASAADNIQARKYFEEAIAIDPGFARAYAALAIANADAYRHDWIDDPDLTARISLQQAQHAMELAPDSSHTSMAMGYVQFFASGNHQQATAMTERTLELDPNNADANMLLAAIHVHAGKPNKAEAYVETSMRLNPDYSALYPHIAALANLQQGKYIAAHDLYKQSLQINPERLLGKIYMVITLVRMEKLEEARWYAEEIMASSPEFDAEQWANKQPYKNRKINQQLRDDLREAGLK